MTIVERGTKEGNVCPYKHLCTNVDNNPICNDPKVETALIGIKRWMDKQNMLHPYNGMYNLAIKNEW